MKTFAYDVEVLNNLFTATFTNVSDVNETYAFYIGLDKEDWNDLFDFLNNKIVLVGYNNMSYDDPILRYILSYKKDNLLRDLVKISAKLVDDNYRSERDILNIRYPKKGVFPWNSIDLMRLLGFDKLKVSLKQVAINLKWHKILDMPINFWENVRLDQLNMIFEYNLNDVLITNELYHRVTPKRELRRDLSRLYNVDLSSASDSKMANLILEHIYSKELKLDISTIKKKRTYRNSILLKECIAPFVEFKTPYMKEVVDRIKSKKVEKYNKYAYGDTIFFANCKFALGIGGLHSEDAAGIFETDDKHIIRDMDVASYYPNLIINNNFYPQHLGIEFIKVLKKITNERISAKESGDKTKSEGLKITINSIFGKMGFEYYWLYDPKQLLSTTLSGQLGLLMLIEDLHLNGISVISANTDGVVCKIPRELENKYYEIARKWEEKTSLKLDYTTYKKYVRRDVNAYLTIREDGTVKQKGIFSTKIKLEKAYRMPIVAKAINEYFISDIPIKKTIENSKDIMDFCLSEKTGDNFVLEHHTTNGIEYLQKTNRYFLSKKGGGLIKRNRTNGRVVSFHVGKTASILNDYNPTKRFEEYFVDFSFYESEAMKIIDDIEPKQMNLFDVTDLKNSYIKKMEFNPFKKELVNKNATVKELNKLGKNQLKIKIGSIANNNEKIDKISPRYVYVLGFDVKEMKATLYCLAKGIVQTIEVDKKAYKQERLEEGLLVYCDKFRKTKTGHSLIDYHITDKIEEEIPTFL